METPLIVAVPELATYCAHTGIGRVFHELCAGWGERVHPVNATFATWNIPLLRNFPRGMHVTTAADLVLLPKVTGAQALRDTGGIPALAVVHDIGAVDVPSVDRSAIDGLTYLSILRSFYGLRHARHLVADSYFTRDRLVRRLPEVAGRVSVIHLGVNDLFLCYDCPQTEARRRIEAILRQKLGAPLLVYVGSEVPRKNIPLLLQVFRQIKDRYPSARLLKVGRANHLRWRARTLQEAGRLGLRIGTDVLIVEDIDDPTLADAYRAADVFVSASIYEGFGLPVLEAMAVGTPVVVSDRGAYPELVGDAGLVVTPEVEQFAQAVEAALTASGRDELSLRGRTRAATFTWCQSAKQYLAVMRGVCGCSAA
jgi:glycosyltransferase involved in cell wall biosynthesis